MDMGDSDSKTIVEYDKKDERKIKLLNIFNKKNIKIIVAVVIMLVAVILYIGISLDSKNVSSESSSDTTGYISTLEYCEKLEGKLEDIISQIDGAGNVKVMISVDGSPELLYVSDTDTKTSTTTSGTTTTTSSSPIIIGNSGNSSGIIMTEKLPNVKGVIVVSSGAGDTKIKLNILNAISTLLDISVDKITILKGV